MAIDITGLNKIELLVSLFEQAKQEQSKKISKLKDVTINENEAHEALKANKRINAIKGVSLVCDLSNNLIEEKDYKLFDKIAGGEGTFARIVREKREKELADAKMLGEGQQAAKQDILAPQDKKDIQNKNVPKIIFSIEGQGQAEGKVAGELEKKADVEVEQKFDFEKSFTQFDDRLLKNKLNRFLQEKGFKDAVQSIYKPDRNNLVTIMMNSQENRDKLTKLLTALVQEHCNIKEVPKDELQSALVPSLLFYSLIGAKVPFEVNALSKGDGTDLDPHTKAVTDSFQILFPVLEKDSAQFLANQIAKNIKKFKNENFKNLHRLPTLNELLFSLKKSGKVSATEIESISNMLTVTDSRNQIGFSRTLFDVGPLAAALKRYFKDDKEMAEKISQAILQPEPATCIDATLLYQFLVHYYNKLDKTGETPECAVMPARQFQKGSITVPVLYDVPRMHYPNTHSIVVIDISGSMNGVRLSQFKIGAVKTVELIAQKPGQFLTLIAYESNSHMKIDRQPLNATTLPEIIATINQLRTMGSTAILPALRMAWNSIRPGENTNVILGTDGAFDEGNSGTFKNDVSSICSAKHRVPIKAFGMDLSEGGSEDTNLKIITRCGEEGGSQLIFTPSNEIVQKVQNLIMSNTNRPLEGIQVNIIAHGKKISSRMLQPFATNEPSVRYVDFIQETVAKISKVEGLDKVTLQTEVTFDDKSNKKFEIEMPMVHLNTLVKASEYEADRYFQEAIKMMYQQMGVRDIAQFEEQSLEMQIVGLAKIKMQLIGAGLNDMVSIIDNKIAVNVLKKFEALKYGAALEKRAGSYEAVFDKDKLEVLETAHKNSHGYADSLAKSLAEPLNVQDQAQQAGAQGQGFVGALMQSLASLNPFKKAEDKKANAEDKEAVENSTLEINQEELIAGIITDVKKMFDEMLNKDLEPLKVQRWINQRKKDITKRLFNLDISTSFEVDLNKKQQSEVLKHFIVECQDNQEVKPEVIQEMKQKIEAFWLEATLSEVAEASGLQVADMAAFEKLDEVNRYVLLEALKTKATEQKKSQETKETIVRMIGDVYLVGQVCQIAATEFPKHQIQTLDEFNKKCSLEERFKIYKKIQLDEQTKEYPEVQSALEEVIYKLAFEKHLVEKIKISLDDFDKLSVSNRLAALEPTLKDDTLDKVFAEKLGILVQAMRDSIAQGNGDFVPRPGQGTATTGLMAARSRPRYLKRTRSTRADAVDPNDPNALNGMAP